MKKIYVFLLACLFSGAALQAQIYSDDLESYNAGDYMGVVSSTYWTTWSGNVGGAEDVQVTTANASSGNNGLYFSSTNSNGGPQDVLIDFGTLYNSGTFTFEADFFVDTGKNAYFNFQGASNPGTTWAMNCNMDGGTIDFDGYASGSYPVATWFTLRIEANLTLGTWEFFIDGVSTGIWNNPVNSIASCDLYPIQNSSYYVDDISFDHQPYTLPQLNAGVSGVNMVGAVEGMSVNPRMTIRNVGMDPITSFDVSLDYNGNQITESVTGINLASLASYDLEFSNSVTLVAGTNVATGIVSNVNGMGQDGDVNDDSLFLNVTPVIPATGRVVVGEEATGTWCQWCPRGAVFMDIWAEKYGQYFAGIAVHNSDPMTDAAYDDGIGTMISGYPSALVDRGGDVDPSNMGPQIEANLQVAPAVYVVNGATWDANTRELKVSISTDFQTAVSGDYRVACAITEDSVTGTTAGYNQSNAYSGGTNGPMGGYENLPASVPASMMVYEHVARGIAPDFYGVPNAFGASVNSGDMFVHNFTFMLDSTWDESKMHIVGMVLEPTGEINNAGYTTIDEAVANGFITGRDEGIGSRLVGPDELVKLYPNPAQGSGTVFLDLNGNTEVSLAIYDLTGRQVWENAYGQLSGGRALTLPLANLEAGLYTVVVSLDNERVTKKLVIQ